MTAAQSYLNLTNTYMQLGMAAELALKVASNSNALAANTEAELKAANAASSGEIVVNGNIVLTANFATNLPITIMPGGKITTGAHTFAINHSFSAGLYQVFSTTAGNVIFAPGAITVAYPQWFGAMGVQSVNYYSELAALLASVSDPSVTTDDTALARIHFPVGDYLSQTTWNMTNIQSWFITGDGEGSILRFSTTNTPGVDLTGARRSRWHNIQVISGSSTTAPKVIFLMARNTTTNSAGWHEFKGVQITGPNSGTTCKALFYSYASEDLLFENCRPSLVNPSVIGYYISSKNDLSISSAYTTIATGEQSCKHFNIVNGTLSDASSNTGATSCVPMYLHNARNVTIDGVDWATDGDQVIKILSDGPGNIVDDLCVVNSSFEYDNINPLYFIFVVATSTSYVIGQLTGNIFVGSSAIIHDASSSTCYLGLIAGNDSAGTPPTYLIDGTSIDLLGGFVDAQRAKIRASHSKGGVYTQLLTAADFAVTTKTGTIVVSAGQTDDIVTIYGQANFQAGTTARASMNLPTGTAPTSPADGDMWRENAVLKLRDGGLTKSVTFT